MPPFETSNTDFSTIIFFCNSLHQVLESFSDRRTYSVEQDAVQSLASAFQQLEKCKSDFNIEDYSLSQTTLEQVVKRRNRYLFKISCAQAIS